MSTLTTLILIASGIAFDPNMGSELMMTTKNCLVRSGADLSYYEIAVLPEGAIVRTFPERNLGQFVAVKMVGGELGTFKNITCDIELINTTSEAFDQEAMTYTARKGDKAALRQIGVEPGKSVSRYKGASLTSGQVYKVLGVSVENERAIPEKRRGTTPSSVRRIKKTGRAAGSESARRRRTSTRPRGGTTPKRGSSTFGPIGRREKTGRATSSEST